MGIRTQIIQPCPAYFRVFQQLFLLFFKGFDGHFFLADQVGIGFKEFFGIGFENFPGGIGNNGVEAAGFVDDVVEIIAASGEGEGRAAAESAVDEVIADVWGG